MRGLGRPGPGMVRVAVGLLLLGLLAAGVVLATRAKVEATYRQVLLAVELQGAPSPERLAGQGARWRERGVGALLFPVDGLADGEARARARVLDVPLFLFWQHDPVPAEIAQALAEAQQAGLEVLLVGGVRRAGPPVAAPAPAGTGTAGAPPDWAKAGGPQIALIELEGSPFWADAARQAPHRAVVAHWVPPEAWAAYQGPQGARARLARYFRAVRERQVRVVVVPIGPDDGEGFVFLEQLAEHLEAMGYRLGSVPSVPPFGASPLARALMGAGVGSGLWLLGGLVRPGRVPAWVRGRTPAILLGLLAAGGAVVPFLPQVLPLGSAVSGRAWVAWLAAVAFPLGAVLVSAAWGLRLGPGALRGLGPGDALLGLLLGTLISVGGGLLVAGLLSSREALLRLELFRGVKAMHLVPPLLAALALLPEPLGHWLPDRRRAGADKGRSSARPAWLQAGLGVAGLLALGLLVVYYVGRTGNELVPVPQWERVLRDRIEEVLGVRPRFKELLGHGALVAGLMVLSGRVSAQGRSGPGTAREQAQDRLVRADLLGRALLVLGSVGQLSVVNTFAHLHQPLSLIFQRVGLGMVGGAAVGWVLGAGLRWGLARWERGAAGRAARQW